MNQELRETADRIMNRADRMISVTFQKEGIHCYPAAAISVLFIMTVILNLYSSNAG